MIPVASPKKWIWKNRTNWLVLLVSLLHLIPVWAFTFIPTQDGISHIYNSYILKQWSEPESSNFHQVYELNLTLFPNWANYAFFYLALHFLPPLLAEKIFVSACVLLFPLSFYYLLSAIEKERQVYAWLGFLYSYNYLLHMGFYNFTLAVPLSLIGIGYWWRNRTHFGLFQSAMLNVLLILTYFSHFAPFVLLLFTISFFAIVELFVDVLKEKNGKWKRKLFFFGYLLPFYFIFINTHLTNPETQDPSGWSAKHNGAQFTQFFDFQKLWSKFLHVEPLVYFNDSYLLISGILLFLVAVGFVLTLIDRIRQKIIFQLNDLFFILVLLLLTLYFKLPWRHGSPAWINPRLNLFIFPLLLGWFSIPKSILNRRLLSGLLIVISFWHLGFTTRDYYRLNQDMQEFMSAIPYVPSNSVISIYHQASNFHQAHNHGQIHYLSPFYHGLCYYGLKTNSLYVGNYEPKYDYFPLHYTNGNWKFKYVSGQIDYMITWNETVGHPSLIELHHDYELIYFTKQLKLYQRKTG